MESSNSCYHQFDPLCIRTSRDFIPSVPGFSAYDLLRNCGYLIKNTNPDINIKHSKIPIESRLQLPSDDSHLGNLATEKSAAACVNLVSTSFFRPSATLLPYPAQTIRFLNDDQISYRLSTTANNILLSSQTNSSASHRKQRSEKRPIPDEQKDDKYFERRRRNNQAAKKSRDARKLREDQIAMKASVLEQENAILRAQVHTLREEASSLRQMLLERKSFEIIRRETDLCNAINK